MKKLLILNTLFFLFALGVSGTMAQEMLPTILKAGDILPSTNLTTLTNTTTSTSQFKYPVIISVFTTWCAVCKKEMPELNTILQEAKKKTLALTVIGIDAGESISKVNTYQKRQRLDFDLLIDTNLTLVKKLQIKGTPVVLVFNKAGKLTYQGNTIPSEWQTLIR